MVYLKGWTSGRSLPILNFVKYPPGAGVRQGCVMSTVLFNLVIDWIMKLTTEDRVKGIR